MLWEGGVTLSLVPLNERVSGLRAVATAISPLSNTSWTRLLPKPVDVPVMKKTRGMMADFSVRSIQTCLQRNVQRMEGRAYVYIHLSSSTHRGIPEYLGQRPLVIVLTFSDLGSGALDFMQLLAELCALPIADR